MSMPDVRFNCPACGQHLEAPPQMSGDEIPCPSCQASISIPSPRPQIVHRPAIKRPSPAISATSQPTTHSTGRNIAIAVAVVVAVLFALALLGSFLPDTKDSDASSSAVADDIHSRSEPRTFGEAIAGSSVSSEDQSALIFWAAKNGLVGEKLEDHPAEAEQLKYDLDSE